MTHTNACTLGLDFGTTNSAIALATPAGAVLATFQDGQRQTTTFRSVLYFDPEELTPTRKPRATAGPEAIRSYVQAGTRGRLIQSLKSFLASLGSARPPSLVRATPWKTSSLRSFVDSK